ncbi:MAG: hypothetical protein H7A21_12095 [Spirochaetales bacterium]|nr:hypothetical protein [Leptospiraceae bacterium]MCP5482168.1 hypothetical protein [Spirochaetales bacterium]MCP5484720.1 hypothetical protein [Spirochaetales bacterium]
MKLTIRSLTCIALLALSAALSAGFVADEVGLAARLRDQIIACTLDQMASEIPFVFEHDSQAGSGGPQLQLRGNTFSEFIGGPRSLLVYSGFEGCVGVAAGVPEPRRLESIERLADMPARRSSRNGTAIAFNEGEAPEAYLTHRFSMYNPAIVAWGAALIPDPAERLDGRSYQELYDTIGRRFLRLMIESYFYLNHRTDINEEALSYSSAALAGEDFHAPEYLRLRYPRALMEYRHPVEVYAFQPEQAIGYWVRRHIDGSAPAVWGVVQLAAEKYDARWLTATRQRYARAPQL